MMFHGSYRAEDVTFLLKPIQVEFMDDLIRKEALIQSGRRHYSEMLSSEKAPSTRYMDLFLAAHAQNLARLATNCLLLAEILLEHYGRSVTIVSLARAGTPIGAIVHRLINGTLNGRSVHYSISIIRDRGIDKVALESILNLGHSPESIAFLDGWTGKGVISHELHAAVGLFNAWHGLAIDPVLNVLTDLAGTARAACSEDYLISSSILNSTISGLISRSVLNEAIGPKDYHGCVYFESLASHDLSQWFVDDVVDKATEIYRTGARVALARECREKISARSRHCLAESMRAFAIQDINLIKPGLGEATRVLLRRNPARVIVRDPDDSRVAHLLTLAEEKQVPVQVDDSLPYHAVSIIRSACHEERC